MMNEKQTQNELEKINSNLQDEINKLNELSQDNRGTWKYIHGHGICWVLENDLMGGTPQVPQTTPPALLGDLIKWGNTLNFENLKENEVVTIKIGIEDPEYANKMQFNIVNHVLEPRIELLKSKKIAVLFMSANDDISTMSNEDMEQAGWTRKEKSLIVNPFEK